MKLCALALLGLALFGTTRLRAADDVKLALSLKAQTEFDRVELPAIPVLRDAAACVQSEAGLLPVTAPEDQSLIHFRKAYCTLAVASLTRDKLGYVAAADEFDRAVNTWPLRTGKAGKKVPAEPVSSGLKVLAAISRVRAGMEGELARTQIAEAVQSNACSSNIMQADVCRQVLDIGRIWLGWMALRANNLEQAGNYFAGSSSTGWPAWLAGRKAFDARNYLEAVASYSEAITIWKSRWQSPRGPAFLQGLGPRPDLDTALADLGGAELLAGDTKSALATLDTAVRTGPAEARPLFLRARAREVAGQMDQALGDYNLASRTAFANTQDQASGEAHLYRGIAFYRRRDYARAENEFTSALNFDIAPGLRPDAVAWRHLAAVAGGGCVAARDYLERSLTTVSPYFPVDEARSLAAGCATVQN